MRCSTPVSWNPLIERYSCSTWNVGIEMPRKGSLPTLFPKSLDLHLSSMHSKHFRGSATRSTRLAFAGKVVEIVVDTNYTCKQPTSPYPILRHRYKLLAVKWRRVMFWPVITTWWYLLIAKLDYTCSASRTVRTHRCLPFLWRSRKSTNYLRCWECFRNSAREAANAAGESISRLSLITPVLCWANIPGSSKYGVLWAE